MSGRPPQTVGHRLILPELLRLVGRGLALEEQELGAQQAAALRAQLHRLAGLRRCAEIGVHLDATPVGRARRLVRRSEVGGGAPLAGGQRRAHGVDFPVLRLQVQLASVRVQDQRSAVDNLEHARACGHQGRDVHRGGENGHVRGRPAACRADAGEPLRIERGELRGQQLVGEHDRLRRKRRPRGGLGAIEHRQHLPLHVQQVRRALLKTRIVERLERGDVGPDRTAPREPGAGRLRRSRARRGRADPGRRAWPRAP